MPNVSQIISRNNKKKIKNNEKSENNEEKKCNFNGNTTCPLDGNCLQSDVIYQATVKTQSDTQTYVGLTQKSFKNRFTKHTNSFRNKNYCKETTLSKHIWKLK